MLDEPKSRRPDGGAALGLARGGALDWPLLASLGVVFLVLLALYAAVLAVLLPNQIQSIVPDQKAEVLGVVYAITSVCSTLATPIAGALSDRTRSRFGRRSPWILGGVAVGGAALALIPMVQGLIAITLLWLVAVIALNSMQPALTAVIADRFSTETRGLASGVVGAAITAGVAFGTFAAGMLADEIGYAYRLLAAAIVVVGIAFVTINPEAPSSSLVARSFSVRDFARSFWVSPSKHPDFAWAFFGRFTIYIGYQSIVTYMLYILQGHVGLTRVEANQAIAQMSIITFVILVVSGIASGFLSDRLHRRKPLVFLASILMAVAFAIPVLEPSLRGMYLYAAVIGMGYGAFISVDLALMTEVLPESGAGQDTGKDLGILSTAINIPQIISPVAAAMLLSVTNQSYATLFACAAVVVLGGSFMVLPIKAVR